MNKAEGSSTAYHFLIEFYQLSIYRVNIDHNLRLNYTLLLSSRKKTIAKIETVNILSEFALSFPKNHKSKKRVHVLGLLKTASVCI